MRFVSTLCLTLVSLVCFAQPKSTYDFKNAKFVAVGDSPYAVEGAIYADSNAAPEARALDLIRRLTFEEKCSLSGGWEHFFFPGVERLGLRPIFMSDASQGLRLMTYVVDVPTTAYPGMLSLAATWNRDLASQFGSSLGVECRACGVDMLLGPGVNMYRLSAGGRNYEYMGEDPYLTSQITVPYVKAMQSHDIIAVLKHFIGNDQDFLRHISSSNISERALREIYLPVWESVAKEGELKGIMTGNNSVNGTPASMHKELLGELLRDEYGFRGLAMTDWQNSSYHIYRQDEVMPSGMNIMMPDNNALMGYVNAEAEKSSERKAEIERLMEFMIYPTIYTNFEMGAYDREFRGGGYEIKPEVSTAIAGAVAEEAIMLLKNTKNILPVSTSKSVVLVETEPEMHTGGGSGAVKGYDHSLYSDAMAEAYGDNFSLVTSADDPKIAEADVVVFLLNKATREGADALYTEPAKQIAELKQVMAKNENVVVFVNAANGMPFEWVDDAKAIVWCCFLGQQRGQAFADIFSGKVSPSAKLPFTLEKRYEDTIDPDYNTLAGKPHWGGNNEYKKYWTGDINAKAPELVKAALKPQELAQVNYSEGIYTGYRWYDEKKIEPLYPFGFGLSYVDFKYSDLKVEKMDGEYEYKVTCKVRNMGKMTAKEIAQLYISNQGSAMDYPEKELKGFVKVELAPKETKVVEFYTNDRSFASWSEDSHGWEVESAKYVLRVGGSSAKLPLSTTIEL